ncbi:MAG: IS21 family transposase, partial [Steroidobacteraceae bacterium]
VWNGAVIVAELRARGYAGGRTTVCDYIRPKRALRKAAVGTVRFETPPGKQLQHDWGEIVVEIAGVERKVYFAVNTLGYSRRFHVYAAPQCDAEHTYESLVRAFEYFGGVTREVWVDNQKAAVIEHTAARLRFHPGFVMLAEHYGFLPKACRPYRPRTLWQGRAHGGLHQAPLLRALPRV